MISEEQRQAVVKYLELSCDMTSLLRQLLEQILAEGGELDDVLRILNDRTVREACAQILAGTAKAMTLLPREIVIKSHNVEAQLRAISEITDQQLLRGVVRELKRDRRVRLAALGALNSRYAENAVIFNEIALENQYGREFCVAAVRRMTDNEQLLAVVRRSPCRSARSVAIEMLPSTLQDYARIILRDNWAKDATQPL